ncbi:hypothetical protein T492DRAFT_831550 [Pavlovales sp. CCMP2436]|nr:hypothetical protein T492DRAFT_831550 [Pavlovales sp. CCMP2436]
MDSFVQELPRAHGRFAFESRPLSTLVDGVAAQVRYELHAGSELHELLGGSAREAAALSAIDGQMAALLGGPADEYPALRGHSMPPQSAVAWLCRASAGGLGGARSSGGGFLSSREWSNAAGWAQVMASAALELVAPFDGVRVVAELSPAGAHESFTVDYCTRKGAGSVRVCDRAHVAHSFRGELFGKAQALHGITFGVEATVACVDASRLPGAAELSAAVRSALQEYDGTNLDDHPDFLGGPGPGLSQSTCEAFARALWTKLSFKFGGISGGVGALLELSLRALLTEHNRNRSPNLNLIPILSLQGVLGGFGEGGGGGGGVDVWGVSPGALRIGGNTLLVDASVYGRKLKGAYSFLVDICAMESQLASVLAGFHNQDVNSLPSFIKADSARLDFGLSSGLTTAEGVALDAFGLAGTSTANAVPSRYRYCYDCCIILEVYI